MGNTFGKRLIYNASSWKGCKEDVGADGVGKNRSECVDKIISYHTGQRIAIPWCQAFVSMILQETCNQFGVQNPIPYTQSTHEFVRLARNSIVKVDNHPLPGSVFFIDWGKTGGAKGTGHTGYVVNVEGNSITTIEGNFGDSVNFGRRPLTQITSYIHTEDIGGDKTLPASLFASAGTGLKIATALAGGYLIWTTILKK
jgi:hypothetical protein